MGSINIGRIRTSNDPNVEAAIQEVATQAGANFQTGTGAPDGGTPGVVYFQHGTADSNGWATVATIYINTQR